jgi:hypothetical protein
VERGAIGKVSSICMILAVVIAVGAVAAYTMYVKRYYNVRDPTYQEALQFISSDQTNTNQYNETYTCINFANDFVKDALNQGYRCGYVIVEFPQENHAMVCFNTSDKGLIFIEPQNDELVTLTTGQPYLGMTILRFSITWPVSSESLSMMVLSLSTLPLFTMTTLLSVTVHKRKHKT